MLRSLTLFLVVLLVSACGLLPNKEEDTRDWSANKFYSEAKEKLNDGNYSAAIKLFEALEARYPYGRFAQQAQLEVVYAYYKDQEHASAIAAAERFIKLHPNHENVDYAYYLKGLANFNDNWGILSFLMQGVLEQDMSERDSKASRESFEDFRVLVTRFPDSKYAPDARQRMAHLINVVAMSEVHVARYYLRRKAYVAAANRAQYALKEYPTTPATEEALFIMIRAYEELGMIDLRNDAARVLQRNFPDSPFLSGLNPIENRPWWRIW
ncbi:MAG: outer membrane protein assembly factor BamD [Nitrosomonas sp.]|nr:outer membrane protein assembly factor BamD [Nitrosomonas sp.]MDP1951617.1 outer membrane protein assembly factor BamD [Nitrosomonas sp.]